jgi:hypothetical protein
MRHSNTRLLYTGARFHDGRRNERHACFYDKTRVSLTCLIETSQKEDRLIFILHQASSAAR